MIAVCNAQGAFLYNCTETEADKRLRNTAKRETGAFRFLTPADDRGCLDYDSNGNRRTEDGMCSWLFGTEHLIEYLIQLGCESVYVQEGTGRYRKYDDLDMLKEAYERVYKK